MFGYYHNKNIKEKYKLMSFFQNISTKRRAAINKKNCTTSYSQLTQNKDIGKDTIHHYINKDIGKDIG